MIETLEQAEAALVENQRGCDAFADDVPCEHCDRLCDVIDLLGVVRRVLANAPLLIDPPRDEVIATLLEREAQPNDGGAEVIPLESTNE